MSAMSIIYGGVSFKSLGIFINDSIPQAPQLSRVTQDIPARRGVLFYGNTIGERFIAISITILASTRREQEDKRRALENYIIQDTNVEKELYFDDMPDWVYYGSFSEIGDYSRLQGYDLQTTLTFTCSDPYRYGEQEQIQVDGSTLLLTPKGEQETYPIFGAIAKQNLTEIGVSTKDQYVYAGGQVNVETGETIVEKYETVFHDTAQNLGLWQRVSNDPKYLSWEIENGHIGKGSDFQQGKDAFEVKTFGEKQVATDVWYGAGLKRMLTAALTDWRVTFRIQSISKYHRSKTKLELYLLDTTGKRAGKLSIKDTSDGTEQEAYMQVYRNDGSTKTVGEFKAASKNAKNKKITIRGKKKVKKTDSKGKVTYTYQTITETVNENSGENKYTDFYGYLALEKIGQKFIATIVSLDPKTRNEVSRNEMIWIDSNGTFRNLLGGFGLVAAKQDIREDEIEVSYTPNYLAFCDLKVEKINVNKQEEVISTSPEVIIFTGDEIVIDCEKGRMYKNGMLWMDALVIGIDWIKLHGNLTEEIAFSDGLDWSITYRPTSY
ncbi:distal tail protein Dit [Rummeliibacillus sp. TYF-LIM-RU47]|uniref:distal tail protein Dit n=1 Tax=Rummeliibacillus sp. TYF-LIM-RU47 TaxID=2608406 RepID=UPI001238A060|nr:distal tail protein Dit [Rummeliibacillus sp. TYF-LIM-RU47]